MVFKFYNSRSFDILEIRNWKIFMFQTSKTCISSISKKHRENLNHITLLQKGTSLLYRLTPSEILTFLTLAGKVTNLFHKINIICAKLSIALWSLDPQGLNDIFNISSSFTRITTTLSKRESFGLVVKDAELPAESVNYKSSLAYLLTFTQIL